METKHTLNWKDLSLSSTMNHIGTHPTRTWQTYIFHKHELVFIAVGETEEESRKYAKLIAAAPELLEALKLAYDLLEEHQGEAKWYLRGHYNKINAAIKKATE